MHSLTLPTCTGPSSSKTSRRWPWTWPPACWSLLCATTPWVACARVLLQGTAAAGAWRERLDKLNKRGVVRVNAEEGKRGFDMRLGWNEMKT